LSGSIAYILNSIVLILLLSIFFSCEKKKSAIEYYDNHKIRAEHFVSNGNRDSSKTYSRNGDLTSHIFYNGNKKHVRHYKNGKLEKEGTYLNNDIQIGIWRYYNPDGSLREAKEFLLIDNKPFLNQNWVFSSTQDTLKTQSNFFKMVLEKDTILINEPVKAKVDLIAPFFQEKNSSVMIIVTKDYSNDFNADFSNLAEVELDTTFNLNIETEMRKALGLKSDFRRTSIFGRYFNDPGPQKFRGIIVEYYYTENSVPDSLGNNYYEKLQYFERDIYVLPES
jgi:hypothetical protein